MSRVEVICEAIRKRALLEFRYQNRQRVVARYCCGISSRGADVLRAVQVPIDGVALLLRAHRT